jgi:predicted nucleic acid-binding protein
MREFFDTSVLVASFVRSHPHHLPSIIRFSASDSAHPLASGKICDALLLACAVKSEAQVIYTWNLKHFQSIAPHLADRIQDP